MTFGGRFALPKGGVMCAYGARPRPGTGFAGAVGGPLDPPEGLM